METTPYILIVDDDPDILEGILTILETQPYRLATARDGKQCMEMVAQETPDLLILDLLMPRMDGWGVIREMRSEPCFASVPIMVLTTVVEDANDVITVLHFDGCIMEWNPKAVEIYGYTEEEAINTNIDIIVPETKRQEYMTAINDLRQGKLVRPFETERQNKDGKNLKMLVTLSLLNNEHGKPIAIATTEHLLEN